MCDYGTRTRNANGRFWRRKPQIVLPQTTVVRFCKRKCFEAANDKSLPNDARLIYYIVDGVQYIDLTRCKKTVQLFDMYYDKYGKGD